MKSNIKYLHKKDAVQGKLKVLEMHENKEIKKLEIEYQHKLYSEKNQYLKAQEDWETEVHNAQLRFQEEELNLKKSSAIRDVKQLEESARKSNREIEFSERRTQLEYELKNTELEQIQDKVNQELAQNQQKINHEISSAGSAQRLEAIIRLRKEGMSADEIETYFHVAFNS
ncbi:hypothetical protein O181_090903 [Austropuccinia psidii MF-1]|uniref:Uncharacterized protein n=1 Tax=Austropuccinia psidii MF-1 TaxID=1389203 RepID=A0A9Q3IWB7_9BASI|nr:hypothetical protein [Austropuccinia psidii MF-1]